MIKLKLFQTTIREYKRFIQQLPINYSNALSGDFSEFLYVAVQTRLMLLRKYVRDEKGNLYLPDIIKIAIEHFPEKTSYLIEFQARFEKLCDQTLNHVLANGTKRTLNQSIDDTMYGLYLHADKKKIKRIAQDNELLRVYCVATFVKEIEALVIELSNFFESNGIPFIEKANKFYAPVIQFESQELETKNNITGSPYWSNIIGSDMTEKDINDEIINFLTQYSLEEWKLWETAYSFINLLKQENFSYDQMKQLVYNQTIKDWGDFSKAIKYYKAISSPGMSTTIRYNKQHDVAYIYMLPQVVKSFNINSPQIISDIHIITLVKDQKIGEWRVFAFGGRVDPFIRC